MELARLNSPYMDLDVLLSSSFFVRRLEMVCFPYSVGSTRIMPSVGEFMLGRFHLSQKLLDFLCTELDSADSIQLTSHCFLLALTRINVFCQI